MHDQKHLIYSHITVIKFIKWIYQRQNRWKVLNTDK